MRLFTEPTGHLLSECERTVMKDLRKETDYDERKIILCDTILELK